MGNETVFGRALKNLRLDYSENIRNMAKKLGISPSYLSAIENGVRNIPEDFIPQLCRLYQLEEDYKEKLYLLKTQTQGYATINLGSNNQIPELKTILKLCNEYQYYSAEQLNQLKVLIDSFNLKKENK